MNGKGKNTKQLTCGIKNNRLELTTTNNLIEFLSKKILDKGGVNMGEWKEPYTMCSTCRATGEVTCPKCFGSGTDVNTDENCSMCKGSGNVVCPACKGDTYVRT